MAPELKKQPPATGLSTVEGAAIGVATGVAGAVIPYPLDTFQRIKQMNPKDAKEFKTEIESLWKSSPNPITAGGKVVRRFYSALPEKILKNSLGFGVMVGTTNLLTNRLLADKRLEKISHRTGPSIGRDLKINYAIRHEPVEPKEKSPGKIKAKHVAHRWTPLSPEARLTWTNLSLKDKRGINGLVKDFGKKVQNHNKNFLIHRSGKGDTMDMMLKKTTNFIKRKGSDSPLY